MQHIKIKLSTISFILICLFSSTKTIAQTFALTSSVGFGKPYIIESIEERKKLTIGFAPILMLGLKILPKNNKYWTMNFNIHYFETRIEGTTKITNTQVNGFISNTTYFLIAEKEKPLKLNSRWRFINAYGIGLSHETYLENPEIDARKNTYASLITYAGFGYAINDKITLRITDSIIMTDFIKGIYYLAGNWKGQSAGEDISENILLGLTYNFK